MMIEHSFMGMNEASFIINWLLSISIAVYDMESDWLIDWMIHLWI